jgi:hypothetical protein
MKGLCGYKPRQTVSVPSLKALPSEAQEKVDRLAHELFAFAPKELNTPNGRLFSFRDVLMAALLKDLTQHQDDVGLDDLLFKRLLHAAKQVNVSFPDLKRWGVLIKKAWSIQNSCNADAIGTPDEKQFREMTEAFLNLSEKFVKAEESTRLLQGTVSTLQGTVDSFHKILAKVAANVETIATRAVVDSPVKVFPEQKRGLSDEEESTNPHGRKRPHTEPTQPIAAVFKRPDPGPPNIGKLGVTTVVKLLYEFRTHGIDPSSPRFKVKGMDSTSKTRCKKVWTYAKDQATLGSNRSLVFANKSMKYSSQDADEQRAYVEWKQEILAACQSVVTDMIPSLKEWLSKNGLNAMKESSSSKVKAGQVGSIVEKMDAQANNKANEDRENKLNKQAREQSRT